MLVFAVCQTCAINKHDDGDYVEMLEREVALLTAMES